ncbi:Fis family transcriptional regulator [Burkholderia diffusa]|uniref:TolC family protein n=1 Tax=Burkholderia diffusa TaxID=488732 RepID=UPI000753CF7A|nr:TolC family protein [Burkholderia diffusa]KWF94045.1 Fis family transcriptional regulator [Burkholderia diffusa]
MSGKRIKWFAATCAILVPLSALAFDPLFAQRGMSDSPAAAMIAGPQACQFGPVGSPLTLPEAVSRALCHNPRTRAAWAAVKAQTAAVGVARAAFLPTVSGDWQGVRDSSRTDVNDHPQLSSKTTAMIRSESLTLNWLLFDFGGRMAALRNASELLAAAQATQEATLQEQFATVAKDYDAAQAARGALDVTHEIEYTTAGSASAAQARVDRGVAPISDALQAQTQHEQAVNDRIRAEGDLQAALGTLATDMGLDPNVSIVVPPVTATSLPERDWDEPVARLIDEVKRTHPTVRAALAQFEAAQAKISQTRAAGLPSVSLVGKYSRNNQPASLGLGIPTFPATGRDAYVGVQVSIPFFEGFGRHYQIEQAKAEAERQHDALDGAREQVALDVWTAWHALHTAAASASQSEALLSIAQRAFDAAQHRYRAGVGNILELLNTQAALAAAQQRRLQAMADWQSARFMLGSRLGRLNMTSVEAD